MRQYRVGSVFGIPLQLDLTFLLVLPIFAYLIGVQTERMVGLFNRLFGAGIAPEALLGSTMPWILGFAAAVGLFVGVLFHELGHSLVAMRYGYRIESITLWLFGGLAALAEQPADWREEFAIATAGPVVSVLVGVVCYGLYATVPTPFDELRYVLLYLAALNVALAVFNTIPAFPMDGGRMLRALLARSYPFTRATKIAAEIGKFFALVLGLLGLAQLNVVLVGVAFFVYVAATGEAKQVFRRAALEDVDVEDVMTPADQFGTVAPGTSVADLLDRIFEERHTGYPVLDGDRTVGVVTFDDARQVADVDRDSRVVADVMLEDPVTVAPDEEALEALEMMREHGVDRLPVVEDGELVGLVDQGDLLSALEAGRFQGT